jgi:hypothetical protein
MSWYRIALASGGKPHYCRAGSDQMAVMQFLRARRWQLQNTRIVKLCLHECGHRWTGIDTTQPAQVWSIEPGVISS